MSKTFFVLLWNNSYKQNLVFKELIMHIDELRNIENYNATVNGKMRKQQKMAYCQR